MAMLTVAMMKVGLIVLIFLGVALSSGAGFRHSDLNQTIEVEKGNDVTLQGRLERPVNLSLSTVDVARLDLDGDVYFYRNGKADLAHQMSQYKNRIHLNREALEEGIVKLPISSVTLSDSGPYKVYIPDLEASFITHVIVVPKGQVSKTKGNDTTTTRPPATDPGGENGKAARSHVIPVVVLILFAFAVIGIIVLVKEKYMKKFRERVNRRAEAANGTEMSAERGGLAADDKGNHEQVV